MFFVIGKEKVLIFIGFYAIIVLELKFILKENEMKKVISLVMVLLLVFTCVSCGNNNDNGDNNGNGDNKDTYASVCSQLEKTSMGGTEYSASQIDELEARFTKMNLTAGFSKVNHFRSTSEYAYVIEFENADDAQTFFDKIGTANYNAKKFDSVVVYGKSDSIDSLK